MHTHFIFYFLFFWLGWARPGSAYIFWAGPSSAQKGLGWAQLTPKEARLGPARPLAQTSGPTELIKLHA